MEDSERRKVAELIKEMRSESDSKDGQSVAGSTRLNWMYKGPSDLVDREEYLLGKTIDRTFEVMNTSNTDECLGRTGESSNIPKRLLEKTASTEQVDIAKKILEDPLYAIKQKELEARKRLLNNPVKLKQIKQMLLERSKSAKAHKKQKKKKLKKEKPPPDQIDQLILKYLKKLGDKEKRKALNQITQSDSDYNSTSSNSSESESEKRKERKKHKRKRSPSSSSETSSSSSSEDSRNGYKTRKKKRDKSVKKSKKKGGSSESESEKKKKNDSRKSKSSSRSKRKVESSSSSSSSTSSDDDDSSSSCDVKKKTCSSKTRHDEKDSRKAREQKSDRFKDRKSDHAKRSSDDEDRKSKKSYGLMMPDGSKPVTSNKSTSVKKYEKPLESKTKYVPPPKSKPLSEKEREAKLREMMADAKTRKVDREKNLASHRKKEEKEEDTRTYDDDFMRRQMSHLTSQGSVADRIKSNINNIQRSKSSMDSSFVRK